MVTTENYEEYLMMHADGELDAAAGAELQTFLATHPELGGALEVWQGLKLEADATVVFVDKDALLKKEPKRIGLLWRPQAWAAAAMIILAVMISFFWRNQQQELIVQKPPMPQHNPSKVAPVVSPAPIASERPAPVRKPLLAVHVAAPQAVVRIFARDTMVMPDAVVSRAFNALPVAAVAPQIRPVPIKTDAGIPQKMQAQSREYALPAIHFAVVNQPALNMLKSGLDVRLSQITHAAKAIRETALTVRIGNKNHYLNF